jgi:5-methylcytosine-specific restriction endonuclease McrA
MRELYMAKRDYKKEYQQQKKRGDTKGQLERQRARRLLDKNGVNRKGKDIDHKTPIRKGGKSNLKNLRLRSRKKNRSDNKRT